MSNKIWNITLQCSNPEQLANELKAQGYRARLTRRGRDWNQDVIVMVFHSNLQWISFLAYMAVKEMSTKQEAFTFDDD